MNFDPENLNASSKLMYQEALRRGISCTLFGDNETILMEKDGKSWYTRGSRTSLQSSVGKTIGDYKPLTKSILTHFDIPTAKYVVIDSFKELELIDQLSCPLVMKPIDASHGKDVFTGIDSHKQAKDHYLVTKQGKVIVEEQLKGIEFRIVCVDFKFVAASYRKPAFVTGDGLRTINHLVEEKNKHPWRGKGHTAPLTYIKINDQDLKYIFTQGYQDLDQVPEDGVEVFLKRTANLSTGGEAHNVTDQVSNENKELFEKIARVTDLNVVGIDVMCKDLKSPIEGQENSGVIEVNASPGLRMHHYPSEGSSINIAKEILDYVKKYV